MPKNIVICCDGTGNQYNETYSNVVKLYKMLHPDSAIQYRFYDPGVGTMSDPNVVNPLSKMISKIGGLAFGWGLQSNVTEAYSYLMEYYEPGDKIFLFGFSRGAYTVRVIAALIHSVGLLQRGCQHLIPYAWEIFCKSYQEKHRPIAKQFKETYGRNIDIHFAGVWDTVTSMGIFNRKKLPFTTNNPSLVHIRHAMAIDERRTYYRQNLFGDPYPHQQVKQVWFTGVHSDVGGSYPLNESGLSQVTLQWMCREAVDLGLLIDESMVKQILFDSEGRGNSKPDGNAETHNSLSIWWWILELLPKWRRSGFPIYFPLGRWRRLYSSSVGKSLVPTLHQSVIDRRNPSPHLQQILKGKFIVES